MYEVILFHVVSATTARSQANADSEVSGPENCYRKKRRLKEEVNDPNDSGPFPLELTGDLLRHSFSHFEIVDIK